MKRCTQCGATYDDNNDFCVVDGLPLNDETVTRVVKKVEAPVRATATTVVQPIFIYVLLGALGASVIFMAYAMLKPPPETNRNGVVTPTPSPVVLGSPSTGGVTVDDRSKDSRATNTTTRSNKAVKTEEPADRREQSPTNTRPPEVAVAKGYNGRVIMLNALIRIAPSDDAPAIAVISYNQPVRIGKTAGPNNPWFRVTAANGTTGWMHGNTIEFVR